MVATNLKAETLALIDRRAALAAEMDAIIAALTAPGSPGITGGLVDFEGFPVQGIDIPAILSQRRRLSELRNDYNDITAKVDQNMQLLHSTKLANRSQSSKHSELYNEEYSSWYDVPRVLCPTSQYEEPRHQPTGYHEELYRLYKSRCMDGATAIEAMVTPMTHAGIPEPFIAQMLLIAARLRAPVPDHFTRADDHTQVTQTVPVRGPALPGWVRKDNERVPQDQPRQPTLEQRQSSLESHLPSPERQRSLEPRRRRLKPRQQSSVPRNWSMEHVQSSPERVQQSPERM